MNTTQRKRTHAPPQWQNFWTFDDDAHVIDAQVAHMWQGETISVRVMSHWDNETDYYIDLKSKRDLRKFLGRFDRWRHDLYYHCGTHWRRIPGSIDLHSLDLFLWREPMTAANWQALVSQPRMDWKVIARKYRVAIAMRAAPPLNEEGQPDRSAGIWWICRLMQRAGAAPHEIVSVIEHSKPFQMKREDQGERWAKHELRRLRAKLGRKQ